MSQKDTKGIEAKLPKLLPPPPQQYGTGNWLCGTLRTSMFWVVSDPCGWICFSISQVLMWFAMYAINFIIFYGWIEKKSWEHELHRRDIVITVVHMVLFNYCWLMGNICHWRAGLTEPGAVPEFAVPPTNPALIPEEPKKCKKCDSFKPNRAHHCGTCRRCIVRMDHHCPWINNCVGVRNQKFFILFMLHMAIAAAYGLCLVIYQYHDCGALSCEIFDHERMEVETSTLCALIFVGTIFVLILSSLLYEQYQAVVTGVTGIDQLKGLSRSTTNTDDQQQRKKTDPEKGGLLSDSDVKKTSEIRHMDHGFQVICGDTCCKLFWIWPIMPYWNDKEAIFGYSLSDPETHKNHFQRIQEQYQQQHEQDQNQYMFYLHDEEECDPSTPQQQPVYEGTENTPTMQQDPYYWPIEQGQHTEQSTLNGAAMYRPNYGGVEGHHHDQFEEASMTGSQHSSEVSSTL